MSSLPCVAIVGRPNVGKSTLFNRLVGSRRSLVHDRPGVTRDLIEQKVKWWIEGKAFQIELIDTGGLQGDSFQEQVDAQVNLALRRADVILFMFDGQAGLVPRDLEVLRLLTTSNETTPPMIGVVNKIDHSSHQGLCADFYQTGIEDMIEISAEHGDGVLAIQEILFQRLYDETAQSEITEESEENKRPSIAIVGRPNVGKSTLLNAITGKSRSITSTIAGTTVDAVDEEIILDGKPYLLIDTAGIRKKSKTEQGIEVLSVQLAKKALERADLALLVLDGSRGIHDQDEKIAGLIEKSGCSVLIVVNKWDQVDEAFSQKEATRHIHHSLGFLRYAPIRFTCALHGKGFKTFGKLFDRILTERQRKLSTNEFTTFIRNQIEIHNPNNVKFYFCNQTGKNPPSFSCSVSDPNKIHFSLERHLKNQMRERWGFLGSPIRLRFIKSKGKKANWGLREKRRSPARR